MDDGSSLSLQEEQIVSFCRQDPPSFRSVSVSQFIAIIRMLDSKVNNWRCPSRIMMGLFPQVSTCLETAQGNSESRTPMDLDLAVDRPSPSDLDLVSSFFSHQHTTQHETRIDFLSAVVVDATVVTKRAIYGATSQGLQCLPSEVKRLPQNRRSPSDPRRTVMSRRFKICLRLVWVTTRSGAPYKTPSTRDFANQLYGPR